MPIAFSLGSIFELYGWQSNWLIDNNKNNDNKNIINNSNKNNNKKHPRTTNKQKSGVGFELSSQYMLAVVSWYSIG